MATTVAATTVTIIALSALVYIQVQCLGFSVSRLLPSVQKAGAGKTMLLQPDHPPVRPNAGQP